MTPQRDMLSPLTSRNGSENALRGFTRGVRDFLRAPVRVPPTQVRAPVRKTAPAPTRSAVGDMMVVSFFQQSGVPRSLELFKSSDGKKSKTIVPRWAGDNIAGHFDTTDTLFVFGYWDGATWRIAAVNNAGKFVVDEVASGGTAFGQFELTSVVTDGSNIYMVGTTEVVDFGSQLLIKKYSMAGAYVAETIFEEDSGSTGPFPQAAGNVSGSGLAVATGFAIYNFDTSLSKTDSVDGGPFSPFSRIAFDEAGTLYAYNGLDEHIYLFAVSGGSFSAGVDYAVDLNGDSGPPNLCAANGVLYVLTRDESSTHGVIDKYQADDGTGLGELAHQTQADLIAGSLAILRTA